MDASIFGIFKLGPGPSSSHTIGPMKAAFHFLKAASAIPAQKLAEAAKLRVELYGSLADTGVGHGTGKAILAGLSGMEPETCEADALQRIGAAVEASICGKPLLAGEEDIAFIKGKHAFPFQNTMRFLLLSGDGQPLFEEESYSIGGGFVKFKGECGQACSEGSQGLYLFKNMNELKELAGGYGKGLVELVVANELRIGKISESDFWKRADLILAAMDDSVERGLAAEGLLPGPLGLSRKAKGIYEGAMKQRSPYGRFMALLDAYAFAAAEQNAAGGKMVTAPTLGSSGVMPAVARALRKHAKASRKSIREGLVAAGAIGLIARRNASISGAEVGCQGEIGVASAMAAAMIAQAKGESLKVVENAAEIALEHHLGLTCDPVGGFVQIPCIERNAVAAVHSWNAFMIASTSSPLRHKVSFDEALEAMRRTGRDMSLKYKETSRGGLAVCAGC